jgi:hypothetical protein
MPSIAFRDANTTKSAVATSLRTTPIILCFWCRSRRRRLIEPMTELAGLYCFVSTIRPLNVES